MICIQSPIKCTQLTTTTSSKPMNFIRKIIWKYTDIKRVFDFCIYFIEYIVSGVGCRQIASSGLRAPVATLRMFDKPRGWSENSVAQEHNRIFSEDDVPIKACEWIRQCSVRYSAVQRSWEQLWVHRGLNKLFKYKPIWCCYFRCLHLTAVTIKITVLNSW